MADPIVPGSSNPGPAAGKSSLPRSLAARIDPREYPDRFATPDTVAQRIADVRYHLEMCTQTLKELEVTGAAVSEEGPQVPIGVSPVTIRTLAACLSELLKLEQPQPHREYCPDLCKLLDCPQQPVLRLAIQHAIKVLEETKWRFKSKELKQLREDLEILLGNSEKFSASAQSHELSLGVKGPRDGMS